jgi:hypothetical protein
MHGKTKILELELWNVILVGFERIKVILVEVFASLPALFSIFTDEIATGKQQQGNHDFRKDRNQDGVFDIV